MIDNYLDYQFHNLLDVEPYIKDIEKIWRTSPQYKRYIASIYDKKPFLNTIGLEDTNLKPERKVRIELHHCITLYGLIVLAASYLSDNTPNDKYFDIWDILKEIEYLHFQDLIPTCLLTKTEHDLYHSGLWKYDKDNPGLNLGNTEELVKRYRKYLTADIIEELLRLGANKRIVSIWEDSTDEA